MVEFNIPLLSTFCRRSGSVTACEVIHYNAPNLAKMRAGVPDASRIKTGRSGLCRLIAGYRERINSLNFCQREQPTSIEIDSDRVPAEAAPVCEQSTLISRIAGERALVNNDSMAMGDGVERLTAGYVSVVVLPLVDNDQPRPAVPTHQRWHDRRRETTA